MTVCRLAGATQIIVSDLSETRRATASCLGADITVDSRNEDLETVVKDATNGHGADVAVIAIGRPELLAQAIGLVRKGGYVCAFAGLKGSTAAVDPNTIHYGEITLVGPPTPNDARPRRPCGSSRTASSRPRPSSATPSPAAGG